MTERKEAKFPENEGEISAPVSHEHYTGTNDTVLDGENAIRLELATTLQLLRNSLAGSAPTLYAIEAKKMFDQVGEELDIAAETHDPVARQEAYNEIVSLMNQAAQDVEISGEVSQNDEVKKRFGPYSLKDQKRATVILPENWDEPKPKNKLH